MQTKQLHLRLSEDEMKTLTGIAERCGLNATSLGTVLLKAALTAVLSNRSRFTMHLVFKIEVGDGARSSAGCCELNEPKETKYPRKTL